MENHRLGRGDAGGREIYADAVIRTQVAPTGECANDGIQIQMGIDVNNNGVLDSKEVDSLRTQTICHDVDDEKPEKIFSSLVLVKNTTEAQCKNGGKFLLIGLDNNQNEQLDESEVTQTEVICNQRVEKPTSIDSLVKTSVIRAGEQCKDGGIKIDMGVGSDGDGTLAIDEITESQIICNGTDDDISLSNLLIQTVKEGWGENCLHGGDKIEIGIDTNTNGSLEQDEVLNASYLCNPNTVPVIQGPKVTKAVAGEFFSLSVSTYDEDRDAVDLVIINKPQWLVVETINPQHMALSGIVPNEIGGEFSFKIYPSHLKMQWR